MELFCLNKEYQINVYNLYNYRSWFSTCVDQHDLTQIGAIGGQLITSTALYQHFYSSGIQ